MLIRIETVVFDKTGTLTEGKPSVTDEIVFDSISKGLMPQFVHLECLLTFVLIESIVYKSLSANSPGSGAGSLTRNQLLRLAATAEQGSEHPLASAVLQAASTRKIQLYPLKEDNFSVHPGLGVECATPDGLVLVGNRAFVEKKGISVSTSIDSAMWDLEVQGKTAVCVALDNAIIGIIGIADTCKLEAYSTIAALRKSGIDVWMLTGDNRTTAEAVADELDIPKVCHILRFSENCILIFVGLYPRIVCWPVYCLLTR